MSLEQIPHDQLFECTRHLLLEGATRSNPLLVAYLREIERRKIHVEFGFATAEKFFASEFGLLDRAPSRKPRRGAGDHGRPAA
jgi:hypothetical protein